MLEVKDLHCSYGTTQVLKGVDIRVNNGEVISILGSSGSGKTTLLRCISFLQKADSGTIRFDDFEKDITKLRHNEIRALRMKMGYVFQNFNLFRNMTVRQNVLEGLITARGVDRAEAEQTADEMLEKVGMLHRKDFYPDQLSGGQQQRVALRWWSSPMRWALPAMCPTASSLWKTALWRRKPPPRSFSCIRSRRQASAFCARSRMISITASDRGGKAVWQGWYIPLMSWWVIRR